MAAIIFTITSEGLTASLDAANTGLGLQLTHVSGHNAAGVEIGRWPLSGGIVEPISNTLRFSTVMTSTSRKELYGLKLLGDSLVFATSVGASPLVVVDANIDFAPAFGLALESIPVGSITVTTDPNAPLAIILMLQHVGSAHPHPQYTLKAAFDSHVIQNGLEHGNILSLLNNLVSRFQAMLEFQYAIGRFYWTDQVGNPNTWLQPIIGYETFWRPIVGRSLMSIDPTDSRIGTVGSVFGTMATTLVIENLPPHDHADGDYNRLLLVNGGQTTDATDATGGEPNLGSAGTLQSVGASVPFHNVHPVYLSYCWQRYDPLAITPLRTVLITEDALEINLLSLFISTYGTPRLNERVKFIVAEGVLITATTTLNHALVTGNWSPESELFLDVFGIVAGRGGGEFFFNPPLPPTYTKNGGSAFSASSPITVTVNSGGLLSGGGGAGGTGYADFGDTFGTSGGGGGAPYGTKFITATGGGGFVTRASEDGGRLIGGIGGAVSIFPTEGGTGGDIGQIGAAATSPPDGGVTLESGGGIGQAINGASFVTLVNNGGQVIGGIV